jgi:alpha-tubulin suppressor-like RCC1 family protein
MTFRSFSRALFFALALVACNQAVTPEVETLSRERSPRLFVTTVTPAAGATLEAPLAISVTMSADVDSATVAGSITLEECDVAIVRNAQDCPNRWRDALAIAGTTTLDSARVLVFTPSGRLEMGGRYYRARVLASVKSTSGTLLGRVSEWRFIGAGAAWEPVTATAPGAPSDLVVTAGDTQLSVAFSVSDGGSAITKIEYRLGEGAWQDAGVTASPVVITGLDNGVLYSVRLRAVNGVGTGLASDAATGAPQVSIAGGFSHSLALLADGTVRAWGRNDFYQIGIDTSTASSSVPVAVSGLSNVRGVAAGSRHSLALLADGTVRAWGRNAAGQLGDNTTTDSSTPVAVSGLSNVRGVAAGSNHSLALLADGTVRAWGSNFYGALGIDTSTTISSVPVAVPGLSNVRSIAAGLHHSLALLEDGTVMAWGRNDYEQFGIDTSNASSSVPVAVPGLSNVRSIAAGSFHSLALLEDGTVMAWGYSADRRLGVTYSPIGPVVVSGLANVRSIAAGGSHSLALLENGTVMAWGRNNDGQLGTGDFNSSLPVVVSGL